MGQEFHVLRCYSCESFQVQQVKKVTKWICKLCGEKQSLLKEFGRGSGADCRRHVQKLNIMRGAMMEEQEHSTMRGAMMEEQEHTTTTGAMIQAHSTCSLWKQVEAEREDVPEEDYQLKRTGSSRWKKYLDTPEEEEEEEGDNVSLDRHMTERKRGRIGGRPDGCTPDQANSSSPPRKRSVNPPSGSPAPVSRSHSQWEESGSNDTRSPGSAIEVETVPLSNRASAEQTR